MADLDYQILSGFRGWQRLFVQYRLVEVHSGKSGSNANTDAGKVNSTDFQLGTDLSNADVNRDGKVDSSDCTLLKRYILRVISDFPQN